MPINITTQESYVQNLLYGWSWTGNAGQGATITYTFDIGQLELNDEYLAPATNETRGSMPITKNYVRGNGAPDFTISTSESSSV